jgi:SAM-dependent methyltransferase
MKIYRTIPWIFTRSRFVACLPKRGSVLDVGVGPGEFLGFFTLMKPDWAFSGTDIKRHPKLPRDIAFFSSDFNKRIRAPDNAYDAVVCTHVFEHLRAPQRAMNEINRILRPGGFLYLETPSERSVRIPSFTWVNPSEQIPLNFYDDETHIRPFSPPSLLRLTQVARLKPLRYGYARNWLAVLSSPITFILAFILQKRSFLVHSVWHPIGWASYVIAQKPKR